jgi:hypothetical protein
MDRKKVLKLAYKQTPLPAGVFQIKNHINGKILIGSGANVNGKLTRHQAELKMGVHRNKALQQEWNEYGPEQFSFEVLECLDPSDDPQYDYQEDLAVLEQLWLEKLRPYEEKGYNRRPK